MTPQDYEAWLNQAPAGTTLTYHTGELSRDRGCYGPKMEWGHKGPDGEFVHDLSPLHLLANRIYMDAELGLVILTQQAGPATAPLWQTMPRQFTYRATRTSRSL